MSTLTFLGSGRYLNPACHDTALILSAWRCDTRMMSSLVGPLVSFALRPQSKDRGSAALLIQRPSGSNSVKQFDSDKPQEDRMIDLRWLSQVNYWEWNFLECPRVSFRW
jgi:hypothetical protein